MSFVAWSLSSFKKGAIFSFKTVRKGSFSARTSFIAFTTGVFRTFSLMVGEEQSEPFSSGRITSLKKRTEIK